MSVHNHFQGPDLTTLGELILEDSFKLFDRPKTSRHLFLFDNVLLITKKRRDGSLNYKGHIAVSRILQYTSIHLFILLVYSQTSSLTLNSSVFQPDAHRKYQGTTVSFRNSSF